MAVMTEDRADGTEDRPEHGIADETEVPSGISIGQWLCDALAAARAAGTAAGALDAFCTILGWQEQLEDRALNPDEQAVIRREVARVSYALSALGLEAQPRSFRSASDAFVALRTACEWIDVVANAAEVLAEAHRWISRWMTRAERIVSPLLPLLAELPLLEMAERGHPLNHACRVSIGLVPELAGRCEALWAAWAEASCAHPVARAAIGLRDQVRTQRLRYRELIAHTRVLAERTGAPAAAVIDWVLGSVPAPLGPSDARERLDGRTGFACSDPDTIVAALAVLDIGPEDRFYDLGAGTGLPCLIAALSGAAPCRGIEVHARYVDRARDTARQLGLAHAEFAVGNVATYDWSDGTRFYMFNPFSDGVLGVVAERLRRVAADHPIRIACFHNRLEGFTRIGGEGPLAVYEAGGSGGGQLRSTR
jgi:hypothetical protein